MKILLGDGKILQATFPCGVTGYVASKIQIEPSDIKGMLNMLETGRHTEMISVLYQLLNRFESERLSVNKNEEVPEHVPKENYIHLTNDQPGMLTGDELRKMYAEKLLEKKSWDDALFKICWRSFVAGVNTSSSVLLEIKRLSADLPGCPLKSFIERKIITMEVENV